MSLAEVVKGRLFTSKLIQHWKQVAVTTGTTRKTAGEGMGAAGGAILLGLILYRAPYNIDNAWILPFESKSHVLHMRLTKSKVRLGKASLWQFFLHAFLFNIVYCIGWYTKWRRPCYGYWGCECDAAQMPDEGRTADACLS